MNILLITICAIVLVIGFKWEVTAIHSGSVSRKDNPKLFWSIMALTTLLLLIGGVFQVSGK